MSHPAHPATVCPNCGFPATHNYCAQCGQETHLHKETFWGMVTHFIAHYFHYDSKFWQTLKALWFSPGKLTIAYWKDQRMRYIPPISLYIFISAIFFLAYFTQRKEPHKVNPASFTTLRNGIDSLDDALSEGGAVVVNNQQAPQGSFQHFLKTKSKKIVEEHGMSGSEYVTERFRHNFPKLFFFMIPVVALLLKLLFLRRKQVYFVHHAVFSLHVHSFFFSAFLVPFLLAPFPKIQIITNLILSVLYAVYFLVAIRRVYQIRYFRAIMNTLFIGVGYLVFFLLAIAADFFLILYLA